MNKDNSGPTFPSSQHTMAHSYNSGMSLRDWFAGMALQGIISSVKAVEVLDTPEKLSLACYHQADAMLAQKEKKDA